MGLVEVNSYCYLPKFVNNDEYEEEMLQYFAFIKSMFNQYANGNSKCLLICDFNFDFNRLQNCDKLACVRSLVKEHDLAAYDHLDGNEMGYTYYNEGRNAKSLIDHLFISNALLNNINHYLVSDSGLNFSDYCILRFNMLVRFVNSMYASSTLSSDLEKRSYLWDKDEIASYNTYVTACISTYHCSQSLHLCTFP